MIYKTGTLVHARSRDWVVLPSEREDLLRLKPLDGREDDVCGIFLPLAKRGEIVPSQFGPPTVNDLGSARAARLLFDASRLSLRSAAGPFRCAARLGFRPRSYQMVPLVMALKQREGVRLLLADDVGVGKTVEALLIARELLERREIGRFAVICPPHLCEQWQEELKDKFGIDAVILRTGTQAALDRQVPGDASVYSYFPCQVISIDYIKADNRYSVFASQAPELVIVDEAHACARPQGTRAGQQLRYRLLRALAEKKERNLVLVTATPHSGKEEEFRSLLGLLKPEFESGEWEGKESFRKELARHFVQRKRENIVRWMDEHTPFPKRIAVDFPYELDQAYQELYDDVLLFASDLMANKRGTENQKRFRYWSALALLRGIMSSPRAGVSMLENRAAGGALPENDNGGADAASLEHPHYERLEGSDDELPTPVLNRTELTVAQREKFREFAGRLRRMEGDAHDVKSASCILQLRRWLTEGYSPIVFCRYILTAKYLAERLADAFGRKAVVECVTSEDPDEVRRARVEAMTPETAGGKRRILVATDCLSEGINLQNLFDAVLHYDLPWNPNRLEQREGRVDRFGQTRPEISTCLLYGKDNPMDRVVLRVLYNKARTIRNNIGVSIPFPEDSKVFLDTIFQAILAEAEKKRKPTRQMELFDIEERVRCEVELDRLVTVAEKKESALRTIFAQQGIKAQELEEDLAITDAAVGRPETVYRFVDSALGELFGVRAEKDPKALTLDLPRSAFPEKLRPWLEEASRKGEARLAFRAPLPEGRRYWGRNHDAVEALCRAVLAEALAPSPDGSAPPRVARAAVVLSHAVRERTVLYVLRARHVIDDRRAKKRMVAEEILLRGLAGEERSVVENDVVERLMENPMAAGDLPLSVQAAQLERELSMIEGLRPGFDALALTRARELISQHERYYRALGTESRSDRFRVVEPVIPMDILGIYIFLPGGAS
ncbi:DEAD/DEAH box helicase [Aminithiophilus ramosus]|uniref:DEAD/DEAH box helicase n=2 Tax=Synergistales TaxID=649776 RepID=A0A9Q7EUN7_9BACT|nr:SNF2-related protein [Aminithiophilus ramosus]QTX31823.1 DEAD/DEAH box helicase [Aminithiophilus ramosus]QVL35647.1 DEAD/DEAH box helicase [Synergistota bacterium]